MATKIEGQCDHNKPPTRGKPPRETARNVLINALGLQSEAHSITDEDDFYLLGGDSLLAVQSMERLEELGFKVDFSTFFQTGIIGEILNCLIPPEDANKDDHNKAYRLESLSVDEESQDEIENVPIDVIEWNDSNQQSSDSSSRTTGEEIIQLITDVFAEKDIVYQALGLSRANLESMVRHCFEQSRHCIVILAFFPQLNKDRQTTTNKLVGALIAYSSDSDVDASELPSKTKLLLDYLDYCCKPPKLEPEPQVKPKVLTVAMIGIASFAPTDYGSPTESTKARWKRQKLEVLSRMEKKLLELALLKGFTMAQRVNTSEITMKISHDLGYDLVNKTNLKTFAATEHIPMDQKYENHHGYYMVKYLNNS